MGNAWWILISRAFVYYLPKDRKYCSLEALCSIQLDYLDGREASISGYAALWRWNRKTVRRFLQDLGVVIDRVKGKKHGRIRLQESTTNGTKIGQIRLIDFNKLHDQGDGNGTHEGQRRDIKGPTTKNKTIKPYRKILNLSNLSYLLFY